MKSRAVPNETTIKAVMLVVVSSTEMFGIDDEFPRRRGLFVDHVVYE